MFATDTLGTADRELIAVGALVTARRYHPRARRSKTQNGSRRRVMGTRRS
jgi:hypothetical protein